MEKFVVTPKEDKTVTMTIRIDRTLQEEYNDKQEPSQKAGASRHLVEEPVVVLESGGDRTVQNG